jgi:hypothetical protein
VQNIKIYLTTKISCQARHIRLLGRFAKALAGHDRPLAWTCLASQPYPAPYWGFQRPNSDMFGPSPDTSGLSVLSWVTPALSGFLVGFRRPNLDMFSPQPGHVQPISLIPGYPSLIRLLSQVPEMVARHVQPPTRTCPGY